MDTDDPDENPSIGRAAGWTLEGWMEFGIVGGMFALAIALWARARRWLRKSTS